LLQIIREFKLRHLTIKAIAFTFSFFTLLPAFAADNQATTQFRALLAEEWDWQAREFPERATSIGDYRFNDRLTDLSPVAAERRKAKHREFTARLREIDPAQLTGQDRISYAVFAYARNNEAVIDRIYGNLPFGASDGWAPVSQMNGPHFSYPAMAKSTPFKKVADYENYLKRLSAMPAQIDQMIERMKAAIASGWVLPAIAIQRAPGQIDTQLVLDMPNNLEYFPFTKFPADISPDDQKRLSDAGARVISESLVPAFRKLKVFFQDTYLPAARKELGAEKLPGGAAYYQAVITQTTTTTMTAKEIHELGLSEVARINAEMETVVKSAGFKGTRAEFINFINTDPQFLFTTPEAMLAAYRDIAKRADAQLPTLFAELPRLPYGIRAMEVYEGDNAEHYSRGSGDGTRAGYFDANVLNLKRRSSPTMETLLLHEAVPGHHLQIARQQELKDVPEFRRFGGFTAFTEGWGLYAESLGGELGFYKTPYTKFGQLSAEMHRACRLVIDTGIHSMGWTRDQSIKYIEENAALSHDFATAEVDRYIVWPSQALAYKLGELRIKALRAKAKAALGDRFDLRHFHNAVIDNGALPLDVLEQQIDIWIAEQKKRAA
jgi:uncharacterized protein (DUF885 family)